MEGPGLGGDIRPPEQTPRDVFQWERSVSHSAPLAVLSDPGDALEAVPAASRPAKGKEAASAAERRGAAGPGSGVTSGTSGMATRPVRNSGVTALPCLAELLPSLLSPKRLSAGR